MNDSAPHLLKADATSPFAALLRHIPPEQIPSDEELLSARRLEKLLAGRPPYDLLLLGDVMLGDNLAAIIQAHGDDYPFASMRPLLRKCMTVVANLEAPFATSPGEPTNRYSYRVPSELVRVLKTAGVSAVNLANNHVMDCGRAGVLETLTTLSRAGIRAFGVGSNEMNAQKPVILTSGKHRVGLLGYYWNPRCAATPDLPGAAISDPDRIQAAVSSLRPEVDFLVASFHWGGTYAREPSEKAEMKARLAIDAGADLVVGHHPHVIQPLKFHRGKPIFFSIGNALMGSGNSQPNFCEFLAWA